MLLARWLTIGATGIAPVVTTAKEAIQHNGSEIAQATFSRSGEKVRHVITQHDLLTHTVVAYTDQH